MIIQIALGIVLGFIFLFVVVAFIAGGAFLITKIQESEPEIERIIRPRLRPEQTRYEEMQEMKRRAKKDSPEHWRQK